MNCTVCYETNEVRHLECGHLVCEECIHKWVVTRFEANMALGDIILSCPAHKCEGTFSYEQLKGLLTADYFNEIDTLFTKSFLVKCNDIRFCPSKGCSYAGLLPKERCTGSLECDKCSTKWKDISNYTFLDMTNSFLSNFHQQFFNFRSEMTKLFVSNCCPKCFATITKNGGCQHMVCSQCKFDFCWHCLRAYKNGVHTEQNICAGRLPMLVLLTILIILITNIKTCWSFNAVTNIQRTIFTYGISLVIGVGYFCQLFGFGDQLFMQFFSTRSSCLYKRELSASEKRFWAFNTLCFLAAEAGLAYLLFNFGTSLIATVLWLGFVYFIPFLVALNILLFIVGRIKECLWKWRYGHNVHWDLQELAQAVRVKRS